MNRSIHLALFSLLLLISLFPWSIWAEDSELRWASAYKRGVKFYSRDTLVKIRDQLSHKAEVIEIEEFDGTTREYDDLLYTELVEPGEEFDGLTSV